MRIRAFEALRPAPGVAHKIASPPYDVVTREEARALCQENPLSMLRVIRAEVDLPDETDPYADQVYQRAARNFAHLIERGHLIRDRQRCLYLYQQEMENHRQVGVAALCHIDDYANNLIKRHELTRPDKEGDRTRLTSDLSANTGPVFLSYRGRREIDELVQPIVQTSPLYQFRSEDQHRHTVWRVPSGSELINAFDAVPALYVADGHHRTASAARVGRQRREGNPNHTGTEDYNWFLCVLFADFQLKILPYNRLILKTEGVEVPSILESVAARCELEEDRSPCPRNPSEIAMYCGDRWHRLRFQSKDSDDPVARLDMRWLQENILGPVFGIVDQRMSDRVEFVGGIRGTGYLEEQVDTGRALVAFSMHPVALSQLMEIADSDGIMTSKVTWFEPKLRSGLFIHTFEPARNSKA